MEDNKQLALRIDGAVQSASQEVTNLRAELTATNRRLAELSGGGGPGPGPGAAASASAAADSAAANMENHQHSAQGRDRLAPGSEERRASQTWTGPGGARGLVAPHARGETALHCGLQPFPPGGGRYCSPAGSCSLLSLTKTRAQRARVHTVTPAPASAS